MVKLLEVARYSIAVTSQAGLPSTALGDIAYGFDTVALPALDD